MIIEQDDEIEDKI